MRKNEILATLDKVQADYCQDCFLHKQLKIDKGRRYAHRFCISECTVGETIKQYGKKLISELKNT